MTYKYEAFFSYKRDPQSDAWHETVKDKLTFWLRLELNKSDARMFFDREDITTGTYWREKLSDALVHSKCLVCVWSPNYFRSRWCTSEWRTFHQREQIYKRNLVLPASYHDGKNFPSEARDKQCADFSEYASTIPSFWNSELAITFENRRLKKFACDLASVIGNAPTYQADFPVIEAADEHILPEGTIGRIADS